jgi:hypothetical protein
VSAAGFSRLVQNVQDGARYSASNRANAVCVPHSSRRDLRRPLAALAAPSAMPSSWSPAVARPIAR